MHVSGTSGSAWIPQTSAPVQESARPTLPDGPELIHVGEFIPQGQGYDAQRRQVLTTYYNKDDGVLLSIQNKDGGPEVKHVKLHGGSAENLCAIAPDKGGGVATDGKFVYLADTESVYVYRREDIDAAQNGGSVEPVWINRMPEGSNASYLTVKDGQAYVGQFAVDPNGFGSDQAKQDFDGKPSLVRFDIGAKGEFVNPSAPVETPYYAQGVTATERGLLFSTSFGGQDESPRELVFQQFTGNGANFRLEAAKDAQSVYRLDHYAEGINVIDNEVWVTYESAADDYRDSGVEPRTHIQRIPLGELKDY